ncbi:MAG: porin [Pseudomonadota bacterium]
MKRNVLPVMIGAILTGGMVTAQADVTLFGHIDTSIDATDQDGGSDDVNFNCTTCSIGFKGSEDLGNGLKAIFKLDFQYDTTERNNGRASAKGISNASVLTSSGGILGTVTGANVVTDVSSQGAITDRDQWLGLASNFGQVRIGTISTLYKSHGAMLDPLYRTALQARDRGLQSNLHRGAGEEGQGRATNTARYDSPSWNGLKVGATYTLDSDENDGEDDNPYGVGLSYENGGMLVFADYITNDTGDDDGAWKVGGKYTLNSFALMAQYERDEGLISSKGAGTSGDGADLWTLGGSFTLGNNMLYLGYGNSSGGSNGSTESNYWAWTLAGVHNMSKRTSIYAGFSEIDCDDPDNDVCRRIGSSSGEDDKFSLGMKHKF